MFSSSSRDMTILQKKSNTNQLIIQPRYLALMDSPKMMKNRKEEERIYRTKIKRKRKE